MTEHVESLTRVDSQTLREHAPVFLTTEEHMRLLRARAGDPRALREIYNEYHAQVRSHLFRLLGPDCEIDDLTQIVFARAFNALRGFQGNASVGTWLYRITANTTHNLIRQRFRRDRVKVALRWFNQSQDVRRVATNPTEARDEVHRILAQIRPDLREVFVLYHYEGLTLQEISEVLDKPVSTIGDRLTRARKHIRDLVAASV